MTKREIVIRTLQHKSSDVIPYYLDLTEGKLKDMIRYTGDPQYLEHSDSYLAQERNESFTDLGNGMFKDMFAFVDAEYSVPTTDFEKKYFDNIEKFAFYDELDALLVAQEGKGIKALIDEGYETARRLLTEYRAKLDFIAEFLVQYEVMEDSQFKVAMESEAPSFDELDAMMAEKRRISEEENAKIRELEEEERKKREAELEQRDKDYRDSLGDVNSSNEPSTEPEEPSEEPEEPSEEPAKED